MLSPLLFIVFFAAILLVALERFSEDTDIHAVLAHLQEQPHKVGPETALEYAWRTIWGMLYADDASIVSWSLRGLKWMMVVQVELFGAFSLNVSESKTEIMCMSILHAPAKQIVFNATGQQYHRQTTPFAYLGGSVTETSNLSAEIDQRIRSRWISFRYNTRSCATARRQLCCTRRPKW